MDDTERAALLTEALNDILEAQKLDDAQFIARRALSNKRWDD